MADAFVGTMLADRYLLEEVIGRGGMATVYRATDRRLDRPVAVKILRAEADEDRERWKTEIRLLAGLAHPHLVTLLDAQPADDDTGYLVMELVRGSDLSRHLASDGPSPALSGMVVAQIGEALAVIHEHGILHRDIKPSNILLEPGSQPPLHLTAKLGDFGIAHLLGSDRITRTGTIIGTAAYAAPEQLQGQPATPAADVYALGLVALECATGRPAFAGGDAHALLQRVGSDPEIPASLGAGWTNLLARMTSRDPQQRPTALAAALRARELAADPAAEPVADADPVTESTQAMPAPTLVLPVAAADPAIAPAPSSSPALRPAPAPAPAPPRRRRALTAIVLAAVVALAGIATVLGVLVGAHPGASAPAASTPPATPTPVATQAVATTGPAPAPVIGDGGNGNNGNGKGNSGNGKGNGRGKG